MSPGCGCTATALPDPRLLDAGPFDLAALENGALVTGVSNEFYGRPQQLIAPGLARNMGEGWETARRRDGGQRLGGGVPGLRGRRHPGRAGHQLVPAQRPGHGLAHRDRARRRGLPPPADPPAARHPAPLRARAPPRASSGCGWTSSRTAAWPGCGCGDGRRPRAGPRWDGAGSTPSPTSRRWRCCARPASPPEDARPARAGARRPSPATLPPAVARLLDGHRRA